MPTFNPEITVSTRVLNLVRDAAIRSQAHLAAAIAEAEALGKDTSGLQPPLNTGPWFIEEIRKLGVSIARSEFAEQKKETGDPNKESINDEVTT